MQGGEGLRVEAALAEKWFDREIRRSISEAKKETGGLAGSPLNNQLAKQ